MLFGQNDSQTVYLLWLSGSLQNELVVFFLLFKVHFVQQLVCRHSNSGVFDSKTLEKLSYGDPQAPSTILLSLGFVV